MKFETISYLMVQNVFDTYMYKNVKKDIENVRYAKKVPGRRSLSIAKK